MKRVALAGYRQLEGEARELLGVAALLGPPFPSVLLAEVVTRQELLVIRDLRAAATLGLVRELRSGPIALPVRTGWFEFARDSHRRALASDLGARERELLHERIARGWLGLRERLRSALESLEGSGVAGGGDGEPRARSGRQEEEIRRALGVVERAAFDHLEEAGELTRAARLAAERFLEEADQELAESEDAVEEYEAGLRILARLGRAEHLLARLAAAGPLEDLRELLKAEAWLALVSGWASALAKRFDLALPRLEQAVRNARALGDRELLCHAPVRRVQTLFLAGDHRCALGALDEAVALVPEGAERCASRLLDLLSRHAHEAIRVRLLPDVAGRFEARGLAGAAAEARRRVFLERASDVVSTWLHALSPAVDLAGLGREAQQAAVGPAWAARLLEMLYDAVTVVEGSLDEAALTLETLVRFLELADHLEGHARELGLRPLKDEVSVARAWLVSDLRPLARELLEMCEREGEEDEPDDAEVTARLRALVEDGPLGLEALRSRLTRGIRAAEAASLHDQRIALGLALLEDPELRPEEARRELAELARLAEAAGGDLWRARIPVAAAFRAALEGRTAHARELAEEAERLAGEVLPGLPGEDTSTVAGNLGDLWEELGQRRRARPWRERELAADEEAGRSSRVIATLDRLESVAAETADFSEILRVRDLKANGELRYRLRRLLERADQAEELDEERELLEEARDLVGGDPEGLGILDDVLARLADCRRRLAEELLEERPEAAGEHAAKAREAREEAVRVCRLTRQGVRVVEELAEIANLALDFEPREWRQRFEAFGREALELAQLDEIQLELEYLADRVREGDREGESGVGGNPVREAALAFIEGSRSSLASLGVVALADSWRGLFDEGG